LLISNFSRLKPIKTQKEYN
jgi:hypothetical protein